jgi:hypothetical protein
VCIYNKLTILLLLPLHGFIAILRELPMTLPGDAAAVMAPA